MFALRQSVQAIIFGLCVTMGFFSFGTPVHALDINTEYSDIRSNGIIFANICSDPRPPSGADPCPCRAEGKCTIEHILQVFVNVSYLILALSGSAALIALVYGGFEWVISAGQPERVKRGKDALSGAVIGLVIVFGAYAFINLLIGVLNSGNVPTTDIEDTIDSTLINTEGPAAP